MTKFIPTNIDEAKQYYKDFNQFDIIFITGDPYYDHPLNGVALLSRLLDRKGYKVGIIAQPETDDDYQICGRPKYFFCITSGMMDSMLANYTPMLRKRENVLVPERALMVYTQNVKHLFPGIVTVLGGVEATIRRFTHFDYKENKLRRGILNDTKADVLLFGNAERSLLNLLKKFNDEKLPELTELEGAAFRVSKDKIDSTIKTLPSYEECLNDKDKFNLLTRTHYLLPENSFIEQCGQGFIQHNQTTPGLTEKEMDFIYASKFRRELHPSSKNLSFNERMVEKLKTSVVLGRGCWGSCNFCVIHLVQGKNISQRSKESIINEIKLLNEHIDDLTLPTLNMYGSYCSLYDQEEKILSPILNEEISIFRKKKYCNQKCVGCPNRMLRDDLFELLSEVEKITSLELRSAIRHDVILNQKKLFRKIMQFTYRLKIAPEHISNKVLKQMNKGTRKDFELFMEEYKKINKEQKSDKNLVPYFIAAHPGCEMSDMELLRKYCNEKDIYINLTQIFTPTPGTASTATYYSGKDTFTSEPVYVARSFRERKEQKNIVYNR